jgi:sigma-B regulation protein RsbU (phosphoserine phosphatase)
MTSFLLYNLWVITADGVTEAMNPLRQLFGEGRLAETIASQRNQSASRIVAGLRQHIEDFSKGQPLSDDTTIVVCKVTS